MRVWPVKLPWFRALAVNILDWKQLHVRSSYPDYFLVHSYALVLCARCQWSCVCLYCTFFWTLDALAAQSVVLGLAGFSWGKFTKSP